MYWFQLKLQEKFHKKLKVIRRRGDPYWLTKEGLEEKKQVTEKKNISEIQSEKLIQKSAQKANRPGYVSTFLDYVAKK